MLITNQHGQFEVDSAVCGHLPAGGSGAGRPLPVPGEGRARLPRGLHRTGQHTEQRQHQGQLEVGILIYYPPEVSSMKYCCWGVFRKEYFQFVTKQA